MSKGCLSCCSCLFKCLLVCTNIVSIIVGLILLFIGAVFTFLLRLASGALSSTIDSALSSLTSELKKQGVDINISDLLSNISEVTGSIGWSFLVLGAVVIVLSCIGCCGACCTIRACLIIYAVLVAVILVGQVIVIAIWFSNNNLFKANAKTAMEESLKQFTGISSKNIQSLLQNIIQIFVGCCGVTNGTDFHILSTNWNRTYTYKDSSYSYTFNLTYPLTCCKYNVSTFTIIDSTCPYNNTTPQTSNYQNGCYDAIFNYIDKYLPLNYLFYGLGGVLGFQCLLIVGAAILLINDRKNSNKVKPT